MTRQGYPQLDGQQALLRDEGWRENEGFIRALRATGRVLRPTLEKLPAARRLAVAAH